MKRLREDRGESLIELLVALSIMGTAIAVLLAGLATTINMSVVHREQAEAGVHVRAFAEAVENTVAANPSGYVPCATTSSYLAVYTAPAGFTRSVVEIKYWNGAWANSCGTDQGVQRVTLRVESADGKVRDTLAVILRKPCRSKEDYPTDWPCT